MNLKDFHYELPESRIAKHPAKERGSSKLLVYRKGSIEHHNFESIADQLPSNTTLVFNDTKVIPARIILNKPTGARIEIFLLEPIAPSSVHEEVMMTKSQCTWKCMIGNAKKWKIGSSLESEHLNFKAIRTGQDKVTFEWEGMTFSQLLTEIGKIPLPPYIHREIEQEDKDRYQTVYSKLDGAVAAPTAGLHFTQEIIEDLQTRKFPIEYVTLHVSAGTFQPIKTENIKQHLMHNEQIWIQRHTVEALLNTESTVAVGTTSMRTLESLYWFGVRLDNGLEDFFIRKEDPYQFDAINKQTALRNVLSFMDRNQLKQLGGQTEIFLYPGYQFKMCDGIITNFHMPGSTLILLIAAFVGNDWKNIYQEALNNDYRFLSYGDSSLLIP
ncbi:S-adenosylmethionine:tRNA ribosyltransferase-isomerase [Parvicella tangerina]|uniref:S-adenosylmethionine:tRNA ribosyltransferase-isomerase n=1 Tax=Parvicella tangerina TaxID=2829795 RepID=A0A916JJ90_9FLAO|nr:S-adenosylmethionine:tRNA ribosyltransferase-isomerase [Parvicella tangerina]CAG5077509.1 S-adenosylmethionine:tRNA ribosyltransferase-isomerase [Parvicella tangerina]